MHRLPAPGGQVLGNLGFQGQAEIDLAFLHQGDDRGLGAVQQGEVDVGKLPAIELEEPGKQMIQGGEGRRQAQGSLVLPLELVEIFFQFGESGQHRLGELQQLGARRGEAQPPFAQALQELAAQLLLQGLDLLAQGRLGPEGGFRGPGEAAGLGHVIKAQELLPFHKNNLYKKLKL